LFFLLIIRVLPKSTLFPYTTLFRSLKRKNASPPSETALAYKKGPIFPLLPGGGRCKSVPSDHPAPMRAFFFCFKTQKPPPREPKDRKSTRLNSSHVKISYAVFCLKK